MHLNQMQVQMQMSTIQMQVQMQMRPPRGIQMQVQMQMPHLHLQVQMHLHLNTSLVGSEIITNYKRSIESIQSALNKEDFWTKFKIQNSPRDGHCFIHTIKMAINCQLSTKIIPRRTMYYYVNYQMKLLITVTNIYHMWKICR